ncbi:putative ATP-dependent RNA helicase [uncultured archaeon]|nr:putative ATP-dependent RNA helicase [uncultured archaeon]
MNELLKKYFGYDEFKPMQLDIIKNVLLKKDVMVIMPTGGGKSICYQLPALKLDGLTIVISPLISLMKDQVDGLQANGIEAEFINSSLPFEDIIEIQERIQRKEIKLLYIAPERLAIERFKIFLSTLQISLIAVDEAHCISEWGHDFRPDYRNLKSLRILFPNTPIMALTATATEKVRSDVINQLSLKDPKIFISSFDRKNLKLKILEKKKSFEKILKLLKSYKDQSAIIYCFSRKDAEKIATDLRYHGHTALPYHAGLPPLIRQRNQDMFIKDKVDIIVATIAFGMGIDKPDVRLIIHHTFPKTLEGYYQEIGRAGRDGLSSDCVLFYTPVDKKKHDFFIDKLQDVDSKNKARNKLRAVMNYCEDENCRRKHLLRYFGEDFLQDNCQACDFCLGEIGLLTERKELEESPIKKINDIFDKGITQYDVVLFEKLKVLRKEIAAERNVPPFVIFGDVSLREMAYYSPKTERMFLKIKGVGEQKLKDFGSRFLEVIKTHDKERHKSLDTNPKDKPLSDTEEIQRQIRELMKKKG